MLAKAIVRLPPESYLAVAGVRTGISQLVETDDSVHQSPAVAVERGALDKKTVSVHENCLVTDEQRGCAAGKGAAHEPAVVVLIAQWTSISCSRLLQVSARALRV